MQSFIKVLADGSHCRKGLGRSALNNPQTYSTDVFPDNYGLYQPY